MTNEFQWGPGNPHPLSKMRTELVWDGKYDEYGRRREVSVGELAMPMQRIETVDEPRQRAAAEGQMDLFEQQLAKRSTGVPPVNGEETAHGRDARAPLDAPFRNRLIWGDNKLVMASLLKEFKGKVDLIYIDPPFDVGADFTMDVPIGDSKETVGKDQSTLEMVAYRDMWGKGTDSYLHMMFERLTLMKDLLSDTGCIYVHCDWRMSPYLRCLLDEVLGKDNFQNEVYWYYYNKLHGATKDVFPRATDSILYYLKNRESQYTFHHIAEPREKPIKKLKYSFIGGKIVNDKDESGKTITYLSTERQIDNVWRISMLQPADKTQFLGYATQKPEDVLERILAASTNEGDLVADFFCGSGTTGAVAERLGRRWIMADLGRFAIHTTRKRLIELQRKQHGAGAAYRSFDVFNLGRYERQWWQKDRLKGADGEHRRVVLEFFKAEVLSNAPSPLLHGRKSGAFCHVDGIDGIFTRNEARAVAEAVAAAGGREVYCLAWEFEMELRQHCLALEAELRVKMKLVPIPREIMEKNRTSPPPFLEMAVLEAEVVKRSTGVPPVKKAKQNQAEDTHGQDARAPLGNHGRDARAPLDVPFLNPFEDIEQHWHNLPHWQQGEKWQFVTWRLGDSLPKEKLEQWAAEKEAWLKHHPQPWSEATEKEFHRQFSARVDEWLDAGHGACVMRDPRCARIVAEGFHHFAGERYDLGAFVVMPNHAHVLFRPKGGHALEDIVHSWKSYTSKEINKVLGKKGALWQEDYWDRMIRHEAHLVACVRYVEDNPVKAKLRNGEFVSYRSTGILPVMEGDRVLENTHGQDARAPLGNHGQDARAPFSVDVKLTKFLPSLAEVPSKELEALKERSLKSGFDFIDFWAVDFDWHPGQPFRHDWQDYRTRKDRSLKTVSDAGHEYEKRGKHTICVKVVDVFGCDTSIAVEVTI